MTSLPSNHSDRIERMQTFVRIVEAGSLSAAAEQLGTSQPTVSRRLKALERELGLRLLHRSTHRMNLTEAGTRYFQGARELLASWAAFEADLRGTAAEPEGRLRVVVPTAFGQQLLVAPLEAYLNRYPRVSVEWLLNDARTDFIADAVDCAIHVGTVEDPSVIALRLSEVPRIVVSSPMLFAGAPPPTVPQDLTALPWLALGTFYRSEVELRRVDHHEAVRFPIRPRLLTDSLYALRDAAVRGMGAAIVSSWIVRDDIARGELVHLAPGWHAAPLPVSLVYPYARHYPAKLRRFIDVMRHAMPPVVDP